MGRTEASPTRPGAGSQEPHSVKTGPYSNTMGYEDLTPKTAKIVVIEWLDITFFGNWNDRDEPVAAQAVTVGWLLEDTDQQLVIASSYEYQDETWADIHVFPKHPPEILGGAELVN